MDTGCRSDLQLWSIHTVCLQNTGTGTRKNRLYGIMQNIFTLHRDRDPIVSYSAVPSPGSGSGPGVSQCD